MKAQPHCIRAGLVAALLAMPAAVQAQFNVTTNNGAIIITGYTGTNNVITIPDTIIGLPVTSIGDNAFAGSWVTSVTIPHSVTNIADYVFVSCSNLTNITVSSLNPAYSSVDGVLFNRSQTTLIEYPVGLVGSYTIPSTVTSIGDGAFWAFWARWNLTGVTIPNSVNNIGDYAFEDCSSLTNITIPKNVTGIGVFAFADCSSLMAIMVDTRNSVYRDVDGVLFNKSQTTLIKYPGGLVGSYTIPSGVTSIGGGPFGGAAAFADCSNLTGVTIPNGVTNIGDFAFEFCSSLTSVTIPDSVTSIGGGRFQSAA